MVSTIVLSDHRDFKKKLKEYLTIDPKKTVIVTIDMQRVYLDMQVAGKPLLPDEADRVLKYSKELLDFARQQNIPVIHAYTCRRRIEVEKGPPANIYFKAIRDLNLSQSPDGPEMIDPSDRLKYVEIEGSPQSQVPAQLVAEGDLHITRKHAMDSFYETELDSLIRHVTKRDTVVLTGINTDTCVYATAFSTVALHYKLVVISDCTGSRRGKDAHEMALELMSRGLGWVITVADFKKKVLASTRTAR